MNGAKGKPDIKVKKTLKPTSRSNSNLEAEAHEVALTDLSFSGSPELYTIGGQPHSKGGTPLNLPDKSFIYTNNPEQKITDENILSDFDISGKALKKGMTPAEIAKKYPLNDLRKLGFDHKSDKLTNGTVERMLTDNTKKLGKLALIQEAEKGFPDGIPHVALPYMDAAGITPENIVTGPVDNTMVANFTQGPMKKGGQFKIRIKNTPKYADGGEDDKNPPKKEFALNQEFLKSYMDKLGTQDISGAISPFMEESRGMIPDTQHAVGKGSYGRKDWTSAEMFPDFRNRNAWYFNEHPDFNPRQQKDVESFQKAYNDKAVGMGLSPYFQNQPGSKYSVDGKFGEVTFSVPNLEYKPAAPAIAEKPEEKPIELSTGDPFIPTTTAPALPVKKGKTAGFWTEDLMRVAGNASELSKIKKYMPWESGWQTELPQEVYYDPTRELAANSEQANLAENVLGAFAGPQATSSRLSEIQGNTLRNSADILGRYNNLNVGVANEFEMNRTNILNSDSRARAERATRLYDKGVIANQQYDNATRQARQLLRDSMINAWSNRGRTQALNSMNKQYNVDPSNGFVNFTGVPGKLNGHPQQPDIDGMISELAANPAYKGWDSKDLVQIAKMKLQLFNPNNQIDTVPYNSY